MAQGTEILLWPRPSLQYWCIKGTLQASLDTQLAWISIDWDGKGCKQQNENGQYVWLYLPQRAFLFLHRSQLRIAGLGVRDGPGVLCCVADIAS
jgi:hypothetical protein